MNWLVKLWHCLPQQARSAILKVQGNKRVYRWLMFRHADMNDRANGNRSHLPPAELRYRVGGSADAEAFIKDGKRCAIDIQSALLQSQVALESFTRILDFGCGCGRTLIHLKSLAPNAQIEGTDIDARAIEWCKKNIDFAKFSLSKELPPLNYDSNTFDFIYAISVFTHLDENYQFRWLEELRRIAKPVAILLVTVDSSLTREKAFVFQNTYEEGLFPDWYQNAYHSKEYVFSNFSNYFDVLGYLPRSLNDHQDVVILQKKISESSPGGA